MADLHLHPEGASGHQTPPHGVFRTESGRETYHPDGHAHGPRAIFSSHSYSKSQEDRDAQIALGRGEDHFLIGTGSREPQHASATSYVEEEAAMEPLENVESSSSSGSSTRHGSNGEQQQKIQKSFRDQDTQGMGGLPLARRATKSEIDPEGRMALQRALTGASQRMTRTMSVASPGDPSVDPANNEFDLSKFLKMFRRQIEGEGIEVKQVSVVYKNLNIFGSGKAIQLQKTVSDLFLAPLRFREYVGRSERKQILHSFDGIIKVGSLVSLWMLTLTIHDRLVSSVSFLVVLARDAPHFSRL